MPLGWQPTGESVGAGILASAWSAPPVIERRPDPRPWIEKPLSRPKADMLRAAAAGSLRVQAGRVTIEGRHASLRCQCLYRPPPLRNIDSSSHSPASAAPTNPSRPKSGSPSSSGPPSTVIVIEEPMISAAITMLPASRLAE